MRDERYSLPYLLSPISHLAAGGRSSAPCTLYTFYTAEMSPPLRVKIPAGGGPGPRQYTASPTHSQFAILGPRYCTRTRWSVVPFARAGTFLSFA